jgi:hypothetical protein
MNKKIFRSSLFLVAFALISMIAVVPTLASPPNSASIHVSY